MALFLFSLYFSKKISEEPTGFDHILQIYLTAEE